VGRTCTALKSSFGSWETLHDISDIGKPRSSHLSSDERAGEKERREVHGRRFSRGEKGERQEAQRRSDERVETVENHDEEAALCGNSLSPSTNIFCVV
jgi:hypothetical protein